MIFKFFCVILYILIPVITYANMTLIKVHDGDTITLADKYGKEIKLRLYGIDAPELAQLYGNEAKSYLQHILSNNNITFKEKHKDTYGRTVATVFVENNNINLEMVKAGYAWHYDRYNKSNVYAKAQQYAKENKLGLWQQENPIEPSQYRKGKKNNEHSNNKPLFKSPIKGIVICFSFENFDLTIKKDFCPKDYITIIK